MLLASEIIERCGGFRAVAERLGLDRSGVQRWTYEAPKGTGNRIPAQHWAPIIRMAREKGLALELNDLAPPDAVEAAAEGDDENDQGAAA